MARFISPDEALASESYHQGWDAGYTTGELRAEVSAARLFVRIQQWCDRHGHKLPPVLATQVRLRCEQVK